MFNLVSNFQFVTSTSQFPNSGLVHYYNFDANTYDEVGTTDITLTNATSTTGLISNGYAFDGTDAHGRTDSAIVADVCTYNFWFKLDADADNVHQLLSTRDDAALHNIQIYVDMDNYTGMVYGIRDTSITFGFGTTPISKGVWHMITFVKNTSGATAYLDGELDATITQSTSYTSLIFGIGATYRPNDNTFRTTLRLDGMMDEIGIWDRELTLSEIEALYNSGAGKYYPF